MATPAARLHLEPNKTRTVMETTLPSSSSMDRKGTRGRQLLEQMPIETQKTIRTEVKNIISKVRRKHPLQGMSSYQAFALREECRREVESLITQWSV